MNYYVDENKDENGKKLSIIVFACIGTFIVALGIVVYMLISSYNSFVDARADVEKAQTDVETMMQRRLELIPDHVGVVKSTRIVAENSLLQRLQRCKKRQMSAFCHPKF